MLCHRILILNNQWETYDKFPSRTAIHVLLGINDLRIVTDGGGSVLTPAMAVNIFRFISDLIEEDHVTQFTNQSTDNIPFTVSIGYITRTFNEMQKAIYAAFPEKFI